ncbi:MAG: phosphatase PAP2 family protein [bacterium]
MQDRKYYFKISLIFYAIWIVSFQIVGRYAATLNTHDPTMAIDQMIPLLPDFIWFYELCYIFPLFPLFVIQDFHRLNITLLSIILANVSAFVVYLVYPVAFPRPELGQSIAEKILNLEYATDFYPGANKLPSMHVTFAWFVYFAVRGQKLGKIGEMFIFFLTVMITISTLFVKQHIVMDVAAGVLWALLTWELAKYLYPLLANCTQSNA